ncbi:hypothetical protein GQ457_14G022520 [Hibiscus cannabinus]
MEKRIFEITPEAASADAAARLASMGPTKGKRQVTENEGSSLTGISVGENSNGTRNINQPKFISFPETIKKSVPLHVKYLQTMVECLGLLHKVPAAGALMWSGLDQVTRTGTTSLQFLKGQLESYQLSKQKRQHGMSLAGTLLAVSPVCLACNGSYREITGNHVVVGELIESKSSLQSDMKTLKSMSTDGNLDFEASQVIGRYSTGFSLTVLQLLKDKGFVRRNVGQEIVAGDDVYGGSESDRLSSHVTPKSGVLVKQVNTSDLDEVIGPKTKLVWLESPTNPRLQIADIQIAHANGALVLVDNSIMSPVLSQPLELGADIGMHSATKFIAGHSDVMVGVLAVKEEREFWKGQGLSLEIFYYINPAALFIEKWRHGEAQLNPKHSEPLVWKMALSISLGPFFSSLNSSDPTRSNDSLLLDFPRSFQVKKELVLEGRLQLSAMQFRVNCLGQWNMDTSASVMANYITCHFTELDVEDQEPSVTILLVNIDSDLQRQKTDPMIILEMEILDEILWKGQEIVAGDDIYGGYDRLLSRVTPKSGVLVKRVNTSDLDEVAAVIGPKTKFVWWESSPTKILCYWIFKLRRNWFLEGRLQLSAMQFRVNCLEQWNMDASAVTADYITGHFTELDVEDQEPRVPTLLVNIDSKFKQRISEIAHTNGTRVGRQQYYVTSIVTTVGTWSSASVMALITLPGHFTELDVEDQEPSVSTLLVNIDSMFDPYGAMTTPLYQTATFKQLFVSLPHRLFAKLERADRAFCFTSGMAALSAVANLVGSDSQWWFSLANELYFLQNAVGSGLAPFDCWICLRGIKIMAYQDRGCKRPHCRFG